MMIHLPEVQKMRLYKYNPLFDKDLELEFPNGSFLVLGGNGNGKTTILQSIVYCIAGGLDTEIENNKMLKWNYKYFDGRINASEFATIEVDFRLNGHNITVSRGFKNSSVLGFQVDSGEWIDSPINRQKLYNELIMELGNYENSDDFRFIVHKLLYLPESRPNLAWDTDTQVRILMILCGDVINENAFREKRARLKENDSKKRHATVAVNKAEKDIVTLLEFELEAYDVEDIEEDEKKKTDNNELDIVGLVEELRTASETRRSMQKNISTLRISLSEISNELELLQGKVNLAEQALILETLSGFENKEVQLALHKLISLGLCPACGSKASDLQVRAKRYSLDHCCSLCGTKEQYETTDELSEIHLKLNDKVKEKLIIENEIYDLQSLLYDAEKKEEIFQARYDDYRIAQPVQHLINIEIPTSTKEKLEQELVKLKELYATFDERCIQLERELEEEYNAFQVKATARINRLSELYREYATAFLGIDCKLTPSEYKDRLISLTLFVPEFDGKIRKLYSSCSEAQRFFLDIALRMSIIQLAGELSDGFGTFICETPENALDMSYVKNVAEMFNKFTDSEYSVILSSNIQQGSLAAPILKPIPKKDRKNHVLNLLEVGNLSRVQTDMKATMLGVLNEMLEG